MIAGATYHVSRLTVVFLDWMLCSFLGFGLCCFLGRLLFLVCLVVFCHSNPVLGPPSLPRLWSSRRAQQTVKKKVWCCDVFVVVRWCFCGVWWCFCGGVVVFLWWRGGVFVVV